MTRIAPKPPRRSLSPQQAAKTVGTTGTVTFNGLSFIVRVLETKTAYGNIRFRVTPVAGSGETWVGNVAF